MRETGQLRVRRNVAGPIFRQRLRTAIVQGAGGIIIRPVHRVVEIDDAIAQRAPSRPAAAGASRVASQGAVIQRAVIDPAALGGGVAAEHAVAKPAAIRTAAVAESGVGSQGAIVERATVRSATVVGSG